MVVTRPTYISFKAADRIAGRKHLAESLIRLGKAKWIKRNGETLILREDVIEHCRLVAARADRLRGQEVAR